MYVNVIRLQNLKEDEEKLSLDNPGNLNELIDSYDADAPENKARKYISTVQNDLAAGKFDKYNLTQLQEVEEKFKEAYAVITNGEVYQDAEFVTPYAETIMALTDLQNDTVEKGIENLLNDYASELKKDPASWDDYKPGLNKPQKGIIIEDYDLNIHEDIKMFGMGSVELLLENLPITPQEEVSPGQYPVNRRIFMSSGQNSYKAACVISLPKNSVKIKDRLEEKILFNESEHFSASAEEEAEEITPLPNLEGGILAHYVDVPVEEKKIEAVVVPFPTKKKNPVWKYVAAAVVTVASGIASLIGYNYLASNGVAENPLKHYHGAPSAEVIAPVNEAKHVERSSSLPPAPSNMEVEPQVQPQAVEQQPAPQVAPSAPKKVKILPPVWDPYEDNLYSIQKGDTLGGLYEDYAARGGRLSRSEYIREILGANPHLESASKIYAGQKIKGIDIDARVNNLSEDLQKLDEETMLNLNKAGRINVNLPTNNLPF